MDGSFSRVLEHDRDCSRSQIHKLIAVGVHLTIMWWRARQERHTDVQSIHAARRAGSHGQRCYPKFFWAATYWSSKLRAGCWPNARGSQGRVCEGLSGVKHASLARRARTHRRAATLPSRGSGRALSQGQPGDPSRIGPRGLHQGLRATHGTSRPFDSMARPERFELPTPLVRRLTRFWCI
jgi:hypothetical protein